MDDGVLEERAALMAWLDTGRSDDICIVCGARHAPAAASASQDRYASAR